MPNDDRSYEVGYGKPPKNHRFKKGQSGNPRGRPKKKSLTLAETVAIIRDEPIKLTIGGKKVTMTAIEAAIRRAMNVTLQKGRTADLEKLLKLLDHYGAIPAEEAAAIAKRDSEIVFNKLMNMARRTSPRPEAKTDEPLH